MLSKLSVSTLLLPLLLLVGCGSTPQATPKFSTVKPVPPLAGTIEALIRIENTEPRIRRSQGLALELKLVNNSDKEAIIYNELEPGWLVMIEVLRTDVPLSEDEYKRTPRSETFTRGRGGRYHYAALPPRGFVGCGYWLMPNSPFWDLSPGRYVLRVIYGNGYELCVGSPIFTDQDVEELGTRAVVPLLTGLIVSNEVTFEVLADE